VETEKARASELPKVESAVDTEELLPEFCTRM